MVRSFPWVRRQAAPIAVDFGHRIVRMLQVVRKQSHLELLHYAQRELPLGVEDGPELDRLQALAVEDMLKKEKFTGRDVVTSLGWTDLTIRNIRVPNVPPSQLQQTVQQEAASQLGIDLQTTDVRFIPAGNVRQGTTMGQGIIVLAADRTAIDTHIRKLEEMDLTPVAIDAPPCAVFRGFECFLRRNKDLASSNAFVDIGYFGSRILISRGNELIFVKPIPIGGRRFDEFVAQQLDLTISDAAKLRVRLHRHHAVLMTGCAYPPDSAEVVSDSMRRAILDAIRPAIDHLGKEIAQSLRYCAATFRGPRVEAVTAIGGEAFNTDMLQLLSDQVNVPFMTGKPLRNMTLESSFQTGDRRTGQPEWATVLGLGLKPLRASMVKA